MATPGGLEPPTNSLEGCCSNPLSYGAAFAQTYRQTGTGASALCAAKFGPSGIEPKAILARHQKTAVTVTNPTIFTADLMKPCWLRF